MLSDDTVTGILVAAIASGKRTWSDDDVRLIELATSQARLTLETARVRQREHTVAETLQEALLPALPERFPPFQLAYFYEPALDEASVGGDFYDVFAIEGGTYGIVIGDVSGKGIAAAAQIACVRNMLRYALEHEPQVSRALTRLNTTLVKLDQLTGFATLFVGIFDDAASTLTYASAGHEPALIRRASDDIEQLPSTGAPSGAIDAAEYEEATVTIGAGDTLLLYTDGISEAGPNRREMLGVDGIIAMMRRGAVGESPKSLVDHLMSDVKSYSNNLLRDDACVVAVLFDA